MREEEKKRISQPTAIQKIFRKRWVFPAIYLVCAALILTAVLWFQSNDKNNPDGTDQFSEGTAYNGEEPAVEVSKQLENLEMPVVDPESVVVQTKYYDDKATKEEQEAALVFYNNTYHPNTGIDLVMKDGQSFDVVAAASGTVTKAEKDPILGYVVEIDHQDGLVTHYQSLADVGVESGDTVKQGDVIAKAGQSLFNQEAKTHVHFEVRQDGVPVNPNQFIGKPLTAVKEEAVNNSNESASESAANEEEQKEENASEEAEQSSEESKEKPAEDNSQDTEQDKKQEEPSSSSDASDLDTNA
ncbi:M23 family metallopeptidase [Priestia abyssalis]|uniref:M23 family metallopeptidase n=1 Tax=Priestia abyssalis TaxID=1221450 RepID=UPI000995BAB8|nr:M23 family metallopeptidase [Priestia abyssalis]